MVREVSFTRISSILPPDALLVSVLHDKRRNDIIHDMKNLGGEI